VAGAIAAGGDIAAAAAVVAIVLLPLLLPSLPPLLHIHAYACALPLVGLVGSVCGTSL
jgi:hypothetical protein